MKKLLWLILALCLFTGCSTAEPMALSLTLDEAGCYTGFDALPEKETPKTAKAAGCFVRENSSASANENLWEDFLKKAAAGEETALRIANFFEDDDVVYYTDLFYDEAGYHYFESTAENLSDRPYKYLLQLTGTMPNAVKDSSVTVLTDDAALTFEAVMSTLYSSDSAAAEKVSEFRWLFFE